jgi:hypothetical protein
MNKFSLLIKNYKTVLVIIVLAGITMAAIWWLFISLKPYTISQAKINDIYQQHASYTPDINFSEIKQGQYKITFTSYDGESVEGRLELPSNKTLEQWLTEKKTNEVDIFFGVSAMGRNYLRWWQDSFKGRPTITQVDKIGQMALSSNHMLVAIDARYHGTRKIETLPLSKIMNNLNIWGERNYYEQMIVDTVMDYRHLINGLSKKYSKANITVAGYSMGAQVSIILGAMDSRVDKVLSIVPPNLDNKVALVAPINFVGLLNLEKIWLLTAEADEYAGEKQNLILFEGIESENKHHISFDSDHILPENYTDSLVAWFD